jgi:hypothetical protein
MVLKNCIENIARLILLILINVTYFIRENIFLPEVLLVDKSLPLVSPHLNTLLFYMNKFSRRIFIFCVFKILGNIFCVILCCILTEYLFIASFIQGEATTVFGLKPFLYVLFLTTVPVLPLDAESYLSTVPVFLNADSHLGVCFYVPRCGAPVVFYNLFLCFLMLSPN